MKRILFLAALIIASSLACSSGMSVIIDGDAEAVDAEIFIDGKKAGKMEKHVYSGIGESKERKQSHVIKPGHVFSFGKINVEAGRHIIAFVGKDGERLEKEIMVAMGENYMRIEFSQMIIKHNE